MVRATSPSPLAPAAPRVASPATATADARVSSAPEPSSEQVQQAVRKVTEAAQSKVSTLQFSIDKETGTTLVKIVDAETQDVIRQIPAEEILAIARSIDKVAGLLLKQKA
jgi:flagellar protein FlaG